MFIIQIVDQNSLTKIMKSIDYPVKFYEICINLSKILKSSIILLNFIQKSSGSCFQSHKKNWISWNPNLDKNRWNLHKFTKKIKFILILLNLSKNWVVCVFNLIKTIWISRNLNPIKIDEICINLSKKKIKIQSILVKLIEGSSGSCFDLIKRKFEFREIRTDLHGAVWSEPGSQLPQPEHETKPPQTNPSWTPKWNGIARHLALHGRERAPRPNSRSLPPPIARAPRTPPATAPPPHSRSHGGGRQVGR